MKRFWRNLGILTAVILAGSSPLMAQSGDRVGPHSRTGSDVTIRLFQYQPGRLTVKAGTTVTWINQDEILHTVTSGDPDKRDARFDSSLDGKGESFSFTFSQPGIYAYFCDRHEHMQGEIEVR
jgi:plastocyanin